MIVVTIDMWPKGDSGRAYRLGSLTIINDGSGTKTRRNYNVEVQSALRMPLPRRNCCIERWPALTRPIFALVKAAIEKAGY